MRSLQMMAIPPFQLTEFDTDTLLAIIVITYACLSIGVVSRKAFIHLFLYLYFH